MIPDSLSTQILAISLLSPRMHSEKSELVWVVLREPIGGNDAEYLN